MNMPFTLGTIVVAVLIAIILFVIWAEVIYRLAGKDRKILFGVVYGLGILASLGKALFLMLQSSFANILIGLISLLFIIFVGATIYEQAGNRERRWMYLTLVFPFLALVYQFTKMR